MPSEEWRTLDTASLARSCAAQFESGLIRRPGQTLLRVLAAPETVADSTSANHAAPAPIDGTAGSCSVIELITDDMPFLVDTVQLCVAESGLGIQLLIHPIVRVRRDRGGRLQALQV